MPDRNKPVTVPKVLRAFVKRKLKVFKFVPKKEPKS